MHFAEELLDAEWRLSASSDRRGLRLEKRWNAPFTADLVARAISGEARGLVEM